jgi:hypothetical protein
MKYTGQQILRGLREIDSPYVSALHVGAKDRKYQVWERNGLSFSLVSHGVIDQKFNYIHMNPVNARLCRYPWEYEYSSADFYYQGEMILAFLHQFSFVRACEVSRASRLLVTQPHKSHANTEQRRGIVVLSGTPTTAGKIANKDVNGDFIVSIHYQMTYDILKKYGYGEVASDAGAYYSSYYADRPSSEVTWGNNFIVRPWGMTTISDRPGWNDDATINSQDTSSPLESQRHSMEGDDENIGSLAAKKRGQEFGWSKIFEAAEAGDLSTFKKGSKAAKAFGVGIHALQDSKAHEGVKMEKHNLDKDMGLGEEGLNAYKNGMKITESAVLVVEILNQNYSNIKDGTTIEISGMNKKQLNQLVDAALKSKKDVRFENEYKDY